VGTPLAGIVLGSGLGDLVERMERGASVPYSDIEGMPRVAVAGHAGNLVFGRLEGVPVIVMQGRVHLYGGHTADEVVFGTRLMISLGAATLVITNAAGGIRDDLKVGGMMLIEDHLNLTGHNSLVGPNDDETGPRFVDMIRAYDPGLRTLALGVARAESLELSEGVYAGLSGPTYETPAEVRMLRTLGADAVGMSTVLEVIAARHMGAKVLGISLITNRAAGLGAESLDHDEVMQTAAESGTRLQRVVCGVLQELDR